MGVRTAAFCFFAAVFLFAFSVVAIGFPQRSVPGQILVRPRKQLSEVEFSARLSYHRARQRQTLHLINVRVINVSEDRVEKVLTALRSDPGIEFAERDHLARAAFVPNDPDVLNGDEWHLAKIQAPQAWGITPGSTNVVVAILDSGINAANPDLAGQVLPGYDFVGGDNDVSDDLGHGTAVAGVVVAAGNNGLGVAGVAYGCKVLPVKVMDASGFASYSCVAQGIEYAVDQGARVINLSLAGDSPSTTLQDAINYAWSNNVVVVAAAGNNANTNFQYPAACEHVVAVSATEPDDSLAAFSSYGGFVALSAPGDIIWTTQNNLSNPYGSWRGTSFASPVVAGVAALVASVNPSLPNSQIVSVLEQTADDLGSVGYDTSFGYGRVNAFRAVSAANPDPTDSQPSSELSAPPTPPVVTLTSPANSAQIAFGTSVSIAATASIIAGAVASVQLFANGIQLAVAPAPSLVSSWTPAQPGSYSLTAAVTDAQGLSATSAPVVIHVSQPDTVSPSLKVTKSPGNGARLASPVVLLAGTAGDNAGVDHVEVKVNNNPSQLADGTTNWSAQVVLVAGPNVVRVRSVDLAGNVSPDFVRVFTYVVTLPLLVQTNGWGRVTPNTDGRLFEIGKAYTLRAVPGRGQIFAGWTGTLSPPNSPSLTFTMQSNLTFVANFVPSPFPPVAGSYAGLIANTNGVTSDSSGYFTLTVSPMGVFSCRLLLGGGCYGFSGQFNLAGDALATVRRGTLGPLSVSLHLDLTNGTDQASGGVTDGNWVSELAGDRNVFNAQLNPASQAGQCGFVLQRADTNAVAAATGTSSISKSGAATMRGKLADGRAFSVTSSLAKNGDCPFYLSLTRGSEVLIGWLNFPDGQLATASGAVLWVKTGTNGFAATLQATSAPK